MGFGMNKAQSAVKKKLKVAAFYAVIGVLAIGIVAIVANAMLHIKGNLDHADDKLIEAQVFTSKLYEVGEISRVKSETRSAYRGVTTDYALITLANSSVVRLRVNADILPKTKILYSSTVSVPRNMFKKGTRIYCVGESPSIQCAYGSYEE